MTAQGTIQSHRYPKGKIRDRSGGVVTDEPSSGRNRNSASPIWFPTPLVAGDCIGVTAPSSGVSSRHAARLEFAVQTLKQRGYRVDVGKCVLDPSGDRTREDRAAELAMMLADPAIRAVIPPWGGDGAVEVLQHIDINCIRNTWIVGYSDISTLLASITLLTGMATLHGNNLMDTPYGIPSGMMSWLDIVTLPSGADFSQRSAGVYRADDWDDWTQHPDVSHHVWNGYGYWRRLDAIPGSVDASGLMIGGCIEALAPLADSHFLQVSDLAATSNGMLIYVESALGEPARIHRDLTRLREAGFFDYANAILIGRCGRIRGDRRDQDRAALAAVGALGVPIISDFECGHVPPHLPIVNGSHGRLRFDYINPARSSLLQTHSSTVR